MNAYKGRRGTVPLILTSALAPAALPLGKNPGTHWMGGWVDPRTGLDIMEKMKISWKLGVYVLQLFKIHTSDQFYFILVAGGS